MTVQQYDAVARFPLEVSIDQGPFPATVWMHVRLAGAVSTVDPHQKDVDLLE